MSAVKTIKLTTPPVVTRHLPFLVSVDLFGVEAEGRVHIRVDQKRGDDPPTLLHEAMVTHREGGTALTSFKATLSERGTALLLATAEDEAGDSYRADGAIVEVT